MVTHGHMPHRGPAGATFTVLLPRQLHRSLEPRTPPCRWALCISIVRIRKLIFGELCYAVVYSYAAMNVHAICMDRLAFTPWCHAYTSKHAFWHLRFSPANTSSVPALTNCLSRSTFCQKLRHQPRSECESLRYCKSRDAVNRTNTTVGGR